MITLQPSDEFEALLAEHREALRRFLFSLTANGAVADDLVQETCMVLWRKRNEFKMGTNFKAWAFQVAYYVAKNHRRKAARSQELSLPDEALMDKLHHEQQERDERWDTESQYLPMCLEKLSAKHREVVVRRYTAKVPVQELAEERGMTPNALSQLLFRIKKSLRECLERHMEREEVQQAG